MTTQPSLLLPNRARARAPHGRLFTFATAALLGIGFASAQAQTSFTSTTATTAWNASRWNNSADASPYTSAYTANNAASFTSGSYSFAGMGATVNVGNVTVASGVTVNFASIGSTFSTNGAVRTFNIGTGGLFDFQGQSISTAAGTGFNKTGDGVLALSGAAYTGGFTLNAGTVILRGVNAMGAGGAVTLNGGTVAGSANRDLTGKYTSGITIGGNVQFGEMSTNVASANSTANLTFSNNISLGNATRALTLGNGGTMTLGGVISNTATNGLTFSANSNGTGRFEVTNTANTFTGDININGGEVRFTADGSLGNAANAIVIDGGRLATANSATYTLGAGRQIFIGDAAGTAISTPGTGVLTYNNSIANKAGETGSWAKQGGGTLSLGGVSTYTGETSINNGIVQLTTGNNRLPTGTVVNVGQAASTNVGTLDLNGRDQQIAGLNSVTGLNISSTANNTVTSATAATLTIGGSGNYNYGDGTNANSGVISGAINLVKQGSGSQKLGDTNTFTGTTSVSGGTLELAAEDALGGTSNIAVATGGTLLLSNSGTTDRINDLATITMSGGKLAFTGDVTEGSSPGTGALTLTANSVIDFAGGNDIINFGASNLASWTGSAILSIYNWGGLSTGVGNDRLLFGSGIGSLTDTQLAQIRFYDGGLGSNYLGKGGFVGSLGEVVPIPEPSAVLIGITLIGLAWVREVRNAQSHRRATRRRFSATANV